MMREYGQDIATKLAWNCKSDKSYMQKVLFPINPGDMDRAVFIIYSK